MIKLTKTELRDQQIKLSLLQKYLPTLQLKKALLQLEVSRAQLEIENLMEQLDVAKDKVREFAGLLSTLESFDLFASVKIKEVKRGYENIAGCDIPIYAEVVFEKPTYTLFDTPLWLDAGIEGVKGQLIIQEQLTLANEKKRLLQKELKEVSIRVNLFEKIMIPRVIDNIKKIKIFLGDQQLAAVSQAKVAKRKILLNAMRLKKEEAR